MAPVIRIDEDVRRELERQAIELNLIFGTPNQVLRTILGLEEPGAPANYEKEKPDNGRELRESPVPYTPRPVFGRTLRRTHRLESQTKVAYYHKDGTFYERPKVYPAVFFDANGYVLFETEEELAATPSSRLGVKLGFAKSISLVPGYVRCPHSHLHSD